MWLTVRNGEAAGKSVLLGRAQVVIGRGEECDFVLPDVKVSRRHASIVPLGDAVELRDLGSSNGTFVNRVRVETRVLHGQEQIQLGDTLLATARESPGEIGQRTLLGSRVLGRIGGSGNDSAVHRLLQRSIRRATALAAAALATVGLVVGLFVSGVLPATGGESAAVKRVVRGALPSTVLIEAYRGTEVVESGTGWVLSGREGLIVTNFHVVNGGRTFQIGVADGSRPARVMGVAPCEDLAVLQVRDTRGLKSLPLGRQSSLELGETVVAVGYPANASAEASVTSTTGVVSIARTAFREAALDIPHYPNVVQTDAAINPGSSGGPLLDLRGRLIGVNSAGRTIAPDGRIIQGQNYAIGVDRVRQITRILREGRSLGWTGISFVYPTPEQLRAKRLPVGLIAGHAVPRTDAADAALHGGAVITAVNGIPLDNSLASYCDAIGNAPSGEKLTFTVVERGRSKPRRVTLAVA